MNLESESMGLIHVAVGLVGLVGTGISTFVALMLKAEMANTATELAKIRTEMAQAETRVAVTRAADRDEARVWINGSFMRAKEVEVKIEAIRIKMESIQDRVHDLKRDK